MAKPKEVAKTEQQELLEAKALAFDAIRQEERCKQVREACVNRVVELEGKS